MDASLWPLLKIMVNFVVKKNAIMQNGEGIQLQIKNYELRFKPHCFNCG